MKKVLYSAVYNDSGHPFDSLAQEVKAVNQPEQMTETDAFLVVWGGADINPVYYKHPRHSTTYPGGLRDRIEWGLMNTAVERGIPIIAVCRGAQMACALSGGFLLQDVEGHAGPHHLVNTIDGQALTVNSLHHQMMCGLEMTDHELIAWAPGRKGAPYGYMDDKVWQPPAEWLEPEFVYFKKTRAYAVQWHPEMLREGHESNQWLLNFIKNKEAEIERSRHRAEC